MFKAEVRVELKKGILDAEAKTSAFLLALVYCIARKKPGKKSAIGAICEGVSYNGV